MKHEPISAPPGFAELSKAEQIDYVQALWDQIADEMAGLYEMILGGSSSPRPLAAA